MPFRRSPKLSYSPTRGTRKVAPGARAVKPGAPRSPARSEPDVETGEEPPAGGRKAARLFVAASEDVRHPEERRDVSEKARRRGRDVEAEVRRHRDEPSEVDRVPVEAA